MLRQYVVLDAVVAEFYLRGEAHLEWRITEWFDFQHKIPLRNVECPFGENSAQHAAGRNTAA